MIAQFTLRLVAWPLLLLMLPFVFSERRRLRALAPPRLFFGATSIVTLPALASAMRAAGFEAYSGTVADVGFKGADGFDRVVKLSASHNTFVRRVLGSFEAMAAFVWALRRADVFHLYMDGGFLRRTPLQLWELRLLRWAGKKVILFPYGSDAWAIDRVPDPVYRAALLADYPRLAPLSASIGARLDQFSVEADLVVGCLCHVMVLPKYDALMMTCYGVETDTITPVYPSPAELILRVFHAPNHRNCKGSAFLERAVADLQSEGVLIELDLVQGVSRDEVLRRMSQAHVLVDQLLAGYAMTALEGMALGKIVISGRNWPTADEPFKDLPAFLECPLHWANPATIKDTLRDIATQRERWRAWGEANRRFVERYHSPAAMAEQWSALYPRLGFKPLRVDSAAP